jgi:hypothetical protein
MAASFGRVNEIYKRMVRDDILRQIAATAHTLETLRPPVAGVTPWVSSGKFYMSKLSTGRRVLIVSEADAMYALFAGYEVYDLVELDFEIGLLADPVGMPSRVRADEPDPFAPARDAYATFTVKTPTSIVKGTIV